MAENRRGDFLWNMTRPNVLGGRVTKLQASILRINVVLVKFVLLSMYEPVGGPYGQVSAISGLRVA